jgi:phosphoenolpyruvate phosphomutase
MVVHEGGNMVRAKPTFRSLLNGGGLVRIAGAHDALGGRIAEQVGFDAAWASSFEVSAARCLPDASILTMSEYLDAAANMQKALGIPVVADCDTGYGNNLNVAHMVHEYEAAGITAVSIEDKVFPKMNSFAPDNHTLLDARDFARKIEVAKNEQNSPDFLVIARTESLISGLDVAAAISRSRIYADAGADAILIHSKARSNHQVIEFLELWNQRLPVVIVPTTYPHWHVDDAARAGVSAVIYANQGLRATVSSMRAAFTMILEQGRTTDLEDEIASVQEIFELQQLAEWQKLDA